MLKLLTRITALALLQLSLGQAYSGQLKGVILLNELGGNPIANAEISALGANPTQSDNFGSFVLEFPNHHSGDDVRLTVQKEGYVVVHYILLEHRLPSRPEEQVCTILLCNSSEQQTLARSYFRLKSEEAFERNYARQLMEVKARPDSDARIAKLEAQRAASKESIAKVAETLASSTSESDSPMYQRALQLFADGKAEEALQALDDAKLAKRKFKALAEAQRVAREFQFKGQLLALKLRFPEALKAFKSAVEIVPNDFEMNLSLARLYQSLTMPRESIKVYLKCLDIARARRSKPITASTLNSLGMLYRANNQPDSAREAYSESIAIFAELADQKPALFLHALADVLNNLGVLRKAEGNLQEAQLLYERALQIYDGRARLDPKTYRPNVAMCLHNLGNVYSDQGMVTKAEISYTGSLGIYRELASSQPMVYLSHVAMTLSQLGHFLSRQHRPDEAFLLLEESLRIHRQLAEENPEQNLPKLPVSLHNLATFMSEIGNWEDACELFTEEIQVCEKLTAKAPEAFRAGIGLAKHNLGAALVNLKKFPEAQSALEGALAIRRQLAKQSPTIHRRDVGVTLMVLGDLYWKTGHFSTCRITLKEALRIFREATDKNTSTWSPHLAFVLQRLGDVSERENDAKEGLKSYREALGLYESLALQDPWRYQASVDEIRMQIRSLESQ